MKLANTFILLALLTTTALHSAAAAEASAPEAVVARLYQVHDTEQNPFSHATERAALERFFAKELAGLIHADAVAAKGEVGALEFDPVYDSQDPQITALKVGEPTLKGDEQATVEVTYKDSGKNRKLLYTLQRDAAQMWKISDVRYNDGRTLAKILRNYAREMKNAEG